MKSHILSGKTLALGASALLISLASIAPAYAATNMVPNTTSCPSSAVSTTASNGAHFQVKWNNDNTFTVSSPTPLSHAVTFYVSDYTIDSPDYKGGCFGAAGTYSQDWFKTNPVTLEAGFVGPRTVSVDLPTTCTNLQVDLYYGKNVNGTYTPLNGHVDSYGHNSYNYVAGNFMLTSLNPSCAPGMGGGTPPVVTPPAVTVAAKPVATPVATVKPQAQLVDTGANVMLTSILAAVTAASALFVGTRRTKVSK